MSDRDRMTLLIVGGTILALTIAALIWIWVNTYTYTFAPMQLPTL
jgi:hypothetical protein